MIGAIKVDWRRAAIGRLRTTDRGGWGADGAEEKVGDVLVDSWRRGEMPLQTAVGGFAAGRFEAREGG